MYSMYYKKIGRRKNNPPDMIIVLGKVQNKESPTANYIFYNLKWHCHKKNVK